MTISTNKPVIPVLADGCVVKTGGWLIEPSDDGKSVKVGKVGSQGSVTVKAAFTGGLCSKVYCEETDNDKFVEYPGEEAANILESLAEEVERWNDLSDFSVDLRDSNGNKAGVEDWPEFDTDGPVEGASLVGWFGKFRGECRNATETLLSPLGQMREAGFVVVTFNPDELEGVPAWRVEGRLVELGSEAIEVLKR